jgi:hypothetical protein
MKSAIVKTAAVAEKEGQVAVAENAEAVGAEEGDSRN